MPTRLLASALALCLIVFMIGCDDDEDGCTNCPSTDGQEPTFQTMWPSADGNTWIHDLTLHAFEGDPDDLVEPEDPDPELPDMATLHTRLGQPVTWPSLGQSEGLYRLRFDGDVTTQSGVTAQRLREELFTPESGKQQIQPQPRRLLAHLLSQRPELGAGLTGLPPAGTAKAFGDELQAPLFLGGYAFAATDTGLFGYGDLNSDYSWIYLEGDLAVGHQFSLQLVSDLANDVWLHGRIWSQTDLTIDDRTYTNCLECFYVVDLGVTILTDEQGEPLGKTRAYIYGSVFYAPDLGPVLCHERSQAAYSTAYDPAAQMIILEIEASISGMEVSP
jgi:hypothetical protein